MMIEMAHSNIQTTFDEGQWTKLKLFLRFVVCLSPIVEGDGIVNLLMTIIERACAIQASQAPRNSPLAEDLYVSVLLALPYYVVSDATKADEAKMILEHSKQFEIQPDPSIELLKPFTGQEVPYASQEFVHLVKNAVESMAGDTQWRVDKLLDIDGLIKDFVQENSKQNTFAAVNVPAVESFPVYNGQFKYPRIFFQAYLPTLFRLIPLRR